MNSAVRHNDTNSIKVGYLVAYDWKLLQNSIPRVYDSAGIIVLALDKNRKSWAGNTFDFDEEAFRSFVSSIDIDNKISIYEDDFYDPVLTAMQNEVRERNMLADRMGTGGWHIQLDADEYPIDFPAFTALLKRLDPHPDPSRIRKPINVCGNFVTIIKRTKEGYIYVKPSRDRPEVVPVATQIPVYEHGRRNGYFNYQSPLLVVHETQSRSEEEYFFKLRNWGHNNDFPIEGYYQQWLSLDESNYQSITDLHPMEKGLWQELDHVQAADIEQLIRSFSEREDLVPSTFDLRIRNSRNLSRLAGWVNRLRKS